MEKIFVMLLVGSWVSSAVAQVQPQPPDNPVQQQRRVFLNGSAIDDIRGITLIDMKVTVDVYGNVQLFNPAYSIERRPGMAAQVVRRPVKTTRPITGQVFLVCEIAGVGSPTFDLQVFVAGKLVTTIDGARPRATLDISGYFARGDNKVQFKAVPIHRPDSAAATTMRVTIGYGQAQGEVLAIDRVLLRYERTGRAASLLDERRITFDR